jgi:hypothetical protein
MPGDTVGDHANTSDRERAITTRQVSELVGLAPITLAQMRVRGEGPPFFRAGRSVRYRLGDVLDWRAARTIGLARGIK